MTVVYFQWRGVGCRKLETPNTCSILGILEQDSSFCQGIAIFSLQTSEIVLQLVRWIIWFGVLTGFFLAEEEEGGEEEKSIL